MSNFLPFLLPISFLFILPLSTFCKDVDLRYSNCSHSFNCGVIKDIHYPFWGDTRPDYCGHPSFQLTCLNGKTTIHTMSQTYAVLAINPTNQTLKIRRTDSWKDNCPTQLNTETVANTTFDTDLFRYPDTSTRNLTLFYDCPAFSSRLSSFTCPVNGRTINGSLLVGFEFVYDYLEMWACKNIIVFPADYQTNSTVEDLLDAGFELKYLVNVSCINCQNSGGQCGYDQSRGVPTCFCPDGSDQLYCSSGGNAPKKNMARNALKKNMAIIVPVTLGILVTVLATIVTCCCLIKKSNTSIISWKNKEGNTKAVKDFFKDCELLAPKRYKYKDIKKMTNSFQDKIGQGGFGSVFKGKLPDGRVVAVKILSETKGDGNEFINEAACIGRTSHVNIVTLLGFCIDGPKRALVYEFMPNGSLEKFIYGERLLQTRHLGWEALYKVAVGIARGLEYLHRGCNTRIVHFDIKPHNILLNENFIPKIADFGLSKLSNAAQSMVSMTGARGTPGYIAPELVSRSIGEVSHKSDVYSYGMMVLEMVGGRKNVDVRVTNLSEIYFPPWIHKRLDRNEDLGLHGVTSLEDHEIARKMILVGLWCIQTYPTNRPPMSKVLEMLEGSLEALQLPPKPYLSSPSIEDEGSALGISTMSDEDEGSALGISTMSDEDESSALAQHI